MASGLQQFLQQFWFLRKTANQRNKQVFSILSFPNSIVETSYSRFNIKRAEEKKSAKL
jgi:hypothetical protein